MNRKPAPCSPERAPTPPQPLLHPVLPPHFLGFIHFYQPPPTIQPTPDPPPMFSQQKIPHLNFTAPPTYFNPETNFNSLTFLRVGQNGWLERVPAQMVRLLGETPENVPEGWLDLKWLTREGELLPAHVPQHADLIHLPMTAKVFLEWNIETTCGALHGPMFPLGLEIMIDPTPMIQRSLGTFLLKLDPLRICAANFTDAVRGVSITRHLNQLQIMARWFTSSDPKPKRRRFHILHCVPKVSTIFDPLVRREVPSSDAIRLRPSKGHLTPINPGMTLLYWNVRGLARPSFRNNFQFLLSAYKPNLVILTETRTSRSNTLLIIQHLPFDKFELVEPIGFAGGILILWNSSSVNFEPVMKNRQSIHGLCQVSPSTTSFFLSAIYASPELVLRNQLWSDLITISNNHQLPWLCLGDFNDICFSHEKVGGNPFNHRRAANYLDTMSACRLIDLGFVGPKFTWTNKRRRNHILQRLDRGWGNTPLIGLYPELVISHLARLSSDHCPLLVTLDPSLFVQRRKAFKFEPLCLLDPSFSSFIENSWAFHISIFDKKLSVFSNELSSWQKSKLNNIVFKKKNLLARIVGTQKSLCNHPNSPFLLDLESSLTLELNNILDQEDLFWKTRARSDMISLGDRNTTFFHTSVLIRRKRNKISSLLSEVGEDITTPELIESHISSYFSKIYTSSATSCTTSWPPLLEEVSSPLISISDIPHPFEIKSALFQMGPLKAPGPDGFHAIFYQHNWDRIRDDICNHVTGIFQEKLIPPAINKTTIALIPKIDNPRTIKQFRPIGLCNTNYKIITKIIVNRLRPHLNSLISPNQSSFLPNRGTESNVIIATEILHSMHTRKGKRSWFALKLDLEKAFDKIEWNFIHHCLSFFNFDSASIKLIMSCICSTSLSININGSTSASFEPSRGIRQGDPLSPYIFILCMEYLSRMIHKACEDHFWTPFLIGQGTLPISHLLFADDVLLFGSTDSETLLSLKNTLDLFCTLSGQSINHDKSKIVFSKNTPSNVISFFEDTLKISPTEDLGTYLGFPLSPRKPSKSKLLFILNKVKSKLASWKTSCLSKAGRLCLINSTLSSIPNYYMSIYHLPKSILHELDRVSSNFLWGDTADKKKLHLIFWDHISRPKDLGGLGIRSCADLNLANLTKLAWKIFDARDSFVSFIVRAKYITNRHSSINFSRGSHIWSGIGKGFPHFLKARKWSLGDGTHIRFWDDDWLEVGPIRSFISGPLPLHESDLLVRNVWDDTGWNLNISPLSHALPPNIKNLICSTACQTLGNPDTSFCGLANLGSFNLRQAYASLKKPLARDVDLTWIWKINTLPKIRFFIWLCHWDRLPHNATVASRGIPISTSCSYCSYPLENTSHILKDCTFASLLWGSVTDLPGSNTLHFKDWLKTNLTTTRHPSNTPTNIPWATTFSFYIWNLWTRRNEHVFQSVTHHFNTWKSLAVGQAWEFYASLPFHAPNLSTTALCWKPPPLDHWALNCDGSWTPNLDAGLGGVFRDHQGTWKHGYLRRTCAPDATTSELLAILEGLRIANELRLPKLVIYSDCATIVKLLNSPCDTYSSSLSSLLSSCRAHLAALPDAKLFHQPRETNRVADLLAKTARTRCRLDLCCDILLVPPNFCISFLAEDASNACTVNSMASVEP